MKRPCQGCRSLDGEHSFYSTCTVADQQDWWIVINGVGHILGVYGSALQDMAENHAQAIRDEWSWTRIDVKCIQRPQGERPAVGQKVLL